jgi:hypothetical protein
MMYEAPEWNPHSLSFIRQEEAMTDSFGRVQDPDQHSPDFMIDRHREGFG